MRTDDFTSTLAALFGELTDGTPRSGGYILNPNDSGLFRGLDKLSASAASARTASGSSIAAHVDHVRYGLSLMNRWSAGENPFGDAEWAAAWKKTAVSEDEWQNLRAQLRAEAARWLGVLQTPRDVNEMELKGMIASIAHLAYHIGAIRQMNPALRGPVEQPATS